MRTLRWLILVSLSTLSLLADTSATKPEQEAPKTREEALARAGVKLVNGPTTVPLGKVAELTLPAGFAFVGPDSLDRFYELTQNNRNGNEVGVVMSDKDWMLFFDYDDVGYVKDDDKDKLDAEKLMATMTENQTASNDARKERGWDQMKLQGWATPPHYDAKSNHLKWAIKISSSRDAYKEVWINENIRLLGRGGVMNVTLVSDNDTFTTSEAEADALLASKFEYTGGNKYAEFKTGDKIATYGLAALVVGGGAAVAAKAGLLAGLGAFLGKAWKFVVAALVAIGVGIKRLFNKVTGARPDEPSS